MNLRARLTVWYTSVLGVVLLLFGAAVYVILSFSLTQQVDQQLADTATEILRASRGTVQELRIVISLPSLGAFSASNVYVQVWDNKKTLISASPNLGTYTEPLDPDNLSVDAPTRPHDVILQRAHLRVITYPIIVSDQVAGWLQVGASLSTVDTATSILLVLLIGVGLLSVAFAALMGGASAGRALKPIEVVTNTALQITRADDLSRRIPLAGSETDEVGRLVMAFNETLERLENLFTAQRRFLADVSHELRTPLTAIRGNVDLLRRMGGVDPTSLDAIQSEAERMTRLVGDLLLLAQAESGHLPLASELVELDTVLLEVYQQARVLAGGRMEVSISEVDQVTVIGDRDRLKQLVLNLVGNAIQYTPEGGRVTLSLYRADRFARLNVSDSGPGIPREELPHIFERFYRVEKSRKRTQTGGAGLGLSIAYWIARSHNGKIEVASELGRGSTFSVWLPLSDGRVSPSDATRPTRPLPRNLAEPVR